MNDLNNAGNGEKKKDARIELIRIIASFFVVGLHTINADNSTAESILYQLCGLAVPLFMVTSGYFLLNRGPISFQYVSIKVKKLLRIILIWGIVAVLYRFLRESLTEGVFKLQVFSEYPLEVVKPLFQKGFFWQFWYLWALVLIYLLLPLISSQCSNNRSLLIFFGTGCFVCGLVHLLSVIARRPLMLLIPQTFRIWTWMTYFLLGGLLNRFSEDIKRGLWLKIVCSFILLVAALVERHFLVQYYGVYFAEIFYDDPLTVACVASVFVFVRSIKLARGGIAIFRASGLTFGIYIVHLLVINILKDLSSVAEMDCSVIYWWLVYCISFLSVKMLSCIPFIKNTLTL